jgi:hypothetical protein
MDNLAEIKFNLRENTVTRRGGKGFLPVPLVWPCFVLDRLFEFEVHAWVC